MRNIIAFFFLLLCQSVFCQQLSRQQLRSMFLSATERKTALDSLMQKLEVIDSKQPAEESYLGICNGLCCQHVDGNWAKLKFVLKAKNHLNNAVERDSKDPELRFLRLMLEHFLPSFLGLNKHIEDDLRVIFSNPKFIDEDISLKKKIVDFLLWSKRCNAEQTKYLEKEQALLNKQSDAVVRKN